MSKSTDSSGRADGVPKGAASAVHTLDILVQGAAVDLFRTYGLAVAPMPKRRASTGVGHPGDLVGSIRFAGSGATGTLSLVISPELVQQTRASELPTFQAVDWTRELVNQLMGRLKNRLLRYQVLVQAELASAALRAGKVVFEQGDLYPFRTLRGEISVVLASSLDSARFNYSMMDLGSEGDLMLF
jgi:hypothetical protein